MRTQDIRLASKVIQDRGKILDLDETIEQNALNMIAMYQPVTKDMRMLASSLKMTTYLQRIGEYGVELAQNAIELSSSPHLRKLVSIP